MPGEWKNIVTVYHTMSYPNFNLLGSFTLKCLVQTTAEIKATREAHKAMGELTSQSEQACGKIIANSM